MTVSGEGRVESVKTPDVIRANRVRLRMTQAELAREIGVDTRQINRYETGETEPTLAVARRLAERLHISMDELAGEAAPLNGTWFSAWHNLSPEAGIQTGVVELAQQGRHVTAQPLRAHPDTGNNEELRWSGEFYADGDTLLGGYKVETPTLTQRGLMNLAYRDEILHGTWIRVVLRGSTTGDLCLARSLEAARTRLIQILEGAAARDT